MGIFRRLKMGWRLAMDSICVLRKEKSLEIFPIISALGAIAKTPLYYYATEGKRPTEFENVDFAAAGR